MSNNDISQLGEEIKDAVQSAIDRGDFTELNETIGRTVGVALDRFGNALDRGSQILNEKLQNSQYGQKGSYRNNGQFGNQGTYNQHFDGNYRQADSGDAADSRNVSDRYEYGGQSDAGIDREDNGEISDGVQWYNVGGSFHDTGSFRRHLKTDGWNRQRTDFDFRKNKAEFDEKKQTKEKQTVFDNYSGLKSYADRYMPVEKIKPSGLSKILWLGTGFAGINMLLGGESIILGVMLLAGITGYAAWEISEQKLVKRFQKYVDFLGNKEYCSIDDLVGMSGSSRKKVLRDLKKMIKNGWFRQGALDEQETSLMVTRNSYTQYLDAKKEYQRREAEEQEKRRAELKEMQAAAAELTEEEIQVADTVPAEVRAVIVEGREYLRQIRQSNEAIPGEEISAKISRLEQVTDQIFARVEEHPELVDELRRFMKYYLPTTVKLLNAYEELDSHEIESPNITKSKAEIEKTLDTINHAFENLLDSFFETDRVDIMSDISVMQTMMSQEGLLGSQMQTK